MGDQTRGDPRTVGRACHFHEFRRSAPSARSRRHAPCCPEEKWPASTRDPAFRLRAATLQLKRCSLAMPLQPPPCPVLGGPPQWQAPGHWHPAPPRLSGKGLGVWDSEEPAIPRSGADGAIGIELGRADKASVEFLNAIPCRSYSVPVTPHPDFQERRIVLRKFDRRLLLRVGLTWRRL